MNEQSFHKIVSNIVLRKIKTYEITNFLDTNSNTHKQINNRK